MSYGLMSVSSLKAELEKQKKKHRCYMISWASSKMSGLSEDLIRNIIMKVNQPLVFKQFVKDWTLCQWDVNKWCSVFGEKEIPFRTMRKDIISDEPCWERKCETKTMTFKNFAEKSITSDEWMYFDYKYIHQWFSGDNDLFKEISWSTFGFSEKDPRDSTLWVGNCGAHTPAHQDTYGCNIVAQLHGRKQWILFPPETGGMKPTRVPYEESSVYSELNFYCPANLEPFKGISGARYVELEAGDALVVPRGWWHYVQNAAPLNITLNIWLPHEKDPSTRVSEALIKIFVAQICKDLPQDTAKLITNPNEDDLTDMPLAVLFLQLDTVAKSYLDGRRKARRLKRQRTRDDDRAHADAEQFDLGALLENPENRLKTPRLLTGEELVETIKGNLKKFTNANNPSEEDAADGGTSSLCLTKALIDAFTQSNVIEVAKQNLFAKLTEYSQ